MPSCIIRNCTNHSDNKTIKLFNVPNYVKYPELAKKWTEFSRPHAKTFYDKAFAETTEKNSSLKSVVLTKYRVCEKHFSADCFAEDLRAKLMGGIPVKKLKVQAFPTMNLGSGEPVMNTKISSVEKPVKRLEDQAFPTMNLGSGESAMNTNISSVEKPVKIFKVHTFPTNKLASLSCMQQSLNSRECDRKYQTLLQSYPSIRPRESLEYFTTSNSTQTPMPITKSDYSQTKHLPRSSNLRKGHMKDQSLLQSYTSIKPGESLEFFTASVSTQTLKPITKSASSQTRVLPPSVRVQTENNSIETGTDTCTFEDIRDQLQGYAYEKGFVDIGTDTCTIEDIQQELGLHVCRTYVVNTGTETCSIEDIEFEYKNNFTSPNKNSR